MAGGTHAKTPTGYFETEYFQPWPGIDVSVPASRIDPGAATAFNGMNIRGALTNSPAIISPQSAAPPVLPSFSSGEVLALESNLGGVTVLITNTSVYTDYSTSSPKTFSKIYTFSNAYSQAVHFGSVVIGNNLYFSSAEQLGVYSLGFVHAVIGLSLTNGGSGYTSNPTVAISGGGGSGATGTATFSPGATSNFNLAIYPTEGSTSFRNSFEWVPPPNNLVQYTVGNFTAGFQDGGAVVITGCADSTLNGSATVVGVGQPLPYTIYSGSGNFVANLTHNTPYFPYTGMVGGQVAYTGPGYVNSITLTSGGSGYTTTPTVTITGPPGTGATAIAILGPATGMGVNEITNQNGSGPFIGGDFLATVGQRLVLGNIIGGDGNQSLSVQSVLIQNAGDFYPDSGTVTFTGGGGENATGTFAASGGVISSITITNGGSGYLSPPAVTINASPGNGFSGVAIMSQAVEPSTNTRYPDYFAWSFTSSYGNFDPNITEFAGGFTQLTEARGKITGISVFESVAFVAHNGGFTEAVVNTSSAVGLNVQPFTFNPLWSADQGVVCRYGSMAQYGSLVCFLGEDQTYQLSPNGLTPVGEKVALLLQNYSQWVDGRFPDAGLYGSIVEIEGEKHYLIAFTSNDPSLSGNSNRNSTVYDFNTKSWSCSTWNLGQVTLTCPIYQSYDSQNLSGVLTRDNWLLVGVETTVSSAIHCVLGQVVAGQQLFNSNGISRIVSEQFSIQLRGETPACGRSQSNTTVWVEYENLPTQQSITTTINAVITGQPDINNQQTPTAPESSSFSLPLPYFSLSSSVLPYSVLSTSGYPSSPVSGSSFTSMATSIGLSSSQLVRIVRCDLSGNTPQGMQK